jgi:hypothetical protein
MSELLQDVRLAFRRLRQSPGFTLFAVASLALGIGVTTAIYSAVRTLLWMPLGVPHEDTLLQIRSGPTDRSMSWADFDVFRRDQASFRAIGALTRIRTAVSGAGAPQTIVGDAVSGEFFEALELRPRVGRLLLPADEQTAAHVHESRESGARARHRASAGDCRAQRARCEPMAARS